MTARALPTLPTWVSGTVVTQAQMLQLNVWDEFWANPPSFRMYQSAAQSIPNSAFTQFACDTVVHDSDSGRSGSSPYSYVIPFAGDWTFSAVEGFVANGTGARFGSIYQNGAQIPTTQIGAPATSVVGQDIVVPPTTVFCNLGDVIGIYGYQSSGGALNSDAGHCVFQGQLVSLGSP